MKHKPAWYVAQVLTGTEQDTADALIRAGIRALAPAEVIHERRHGKWRPVRKIVFPGYVFFHTALADRVYHHIKRLPHVIRILGANSPESVPDEQMELVGLLSNDGQDFGMSEAEKIDGKIVVTSGPLLKLESRIEKFNARARRATIAVPVLGNTHQVDVGVIVKQTATKAAEPEKPFFDDSSPTPAPKGTRKAARGDSSPRGEPGDISDS